MKTIIIAIALFASCMIAKADFIIYTVPITNRSASCPCGYAQVMVAGYTRTGLWQASNSSPCTISCLQYTNKICLQATRADGISWQATTNKLIFTPGTTFPCFFNIYFTQPVPPTNFALTLKNFKP